MCKHKQANHSRHVRVARARLQRDGHVSPTCDHADKTTELKLQLRRVARARLLRDGHVFPIYDHTDETTELKLQLRPENRNQSDYFQSGDNENVIKQWVIDKYQVLSSCNTKL